MWIFQEGLKNAIFEGNEGIERKLKSMYWFVDTSRFAKKKEEVNRA